MGGGCWECWGGLEETRHVFKVGKAVSSLHFIFHCRIALSLYRLVPFRLSLFSDCSIYSINKYFYFIAHSLRHSCKLYIIISSKMVEHLILMIFFSLASY